MIIINMVHVLKETVQQIIDITIRPNGIAADVGIDIVFEQKLVENRLTEC